jgi:cysteinyl-tRNA synthetase
MHNGFVNVEGEKMSKSLGNFFTVRDLLDKGVPGEVIRFVLLSTHYRSPMDFTEDKIEEATRTLSKWREMTAGSIPADSVPNWFVDVLKRDLNTPDAIKSLHDMAEARDLKPLLTAAQLLGLLGNELGGWYSVGEILGVFISGNSDSVIREKSATLARRWHELRAEKKFQEADIIRDLAAKAGLEFRSGSAGPHVSIGINLDIKALEAIE